VIQRDPFLDLLHAIDQAGVEFVVIGGFAAILYGSSIVTKDLGICAELDPPTAIKIIEAL